LVPQRCETFATPHGFALGDTASEATTLEYDAESIIRGKMPAHEHDTEEDEVYKRSPQDDVQTNTCLLCR
uniref:E3 ubiquitin-protein ligase PPP1R11 n=1 Tax=Echinostoma caproni TaxID=27848 RepID=A0A183AEE6_9TREM